MTVFRVEKNRGYTVMSNHHLRNKALSLKAKGLLSQKPSIRAQLQASKAEQGQKPPAREKSKGLEVE